MHQREAARLGVTTGSWVTLDLPLQGETEWQVVGLLIDPLNESRVVVPRDTLLLENNGVGRADNLFIKTMSGDPDQDIALAAELRRALNRRGYKLIASSNTDTIQLTSDHAISELNIVIYLLLIMALVIAVVGGVALSGILAISVLERRVEIGIMRAIGASNRRIATLFISEGVLMGWLSWLIAIPFSLPVSMGLNGAVGLALGNDLVFNYAAFSIWLWLIMITFLAAAASWFPARGATRLSVRECLAYQ
jgi:putative ABC transport system permease protein